MLRVEQLPHPPKPVTATVALAVICSHWSGHGGTATLGFTTFTLPARSSHLPSCSARASNMNSERPRPLAMMPRV